MSLLCSCLSSSGGDAACSSHPPTPLQGPWLPALCSASAPDTLNTLLPTLQWPAASTLSHWCPHALLASFSFKVWEPWHLSPCQSFQ